MEGGLFQQQCHRKMRKELLEILVEEYSMEVFLLKLLPTILPEDFILGQNCFIRTHEGKGHLLKSIPKKSRAFKNFPWPVRLLIVHDQDSNNCIELKRKIVDLVRDNNLTIPLLVRIPCHELENWYLGDLKAIAKLYPESRADTYMNKAKYRNVDLLNGSEEIEKFSKNFTKTSCAKNIFQFMKMDVNTSNSFNQFVSGLAKFLN